MGATVLTVWMLVGFPWSSEEYPQIWLQDIATEEECQRIKTIIIPPQQQKGFKCLELKKAR